MEYQNVTNLLGNTKDIVGETVPRFGSIKRVEVCDQSCGTYSNSKQIRFKTSL